ncbi:MAG: hypothetical protein FJ319_07950 [SAR202 cluster bacterium]|nr:hypothetical protein [SAR202 cluster bacterium]
MMASVREAKSWSRHELILTFDLYCKTPFGKIHRRNPRVIALAGAIARSPSAVALKMTNFASLDPTLHQKGMSNASKMDREIWEEFFLHWDSLIAAV